MSEQKNVYGEPLQVCSTSPRTGFTRSGSCETGPEDIVRGIGEGIAFLVNDIACAVRKAGFPVKEARASGGLSRLSRLVQFQADLLQAPIRLNPEKEVTGLGVALLAGLRLDPSRRGRLYRPRMPRRQARDLQSKWQMFVRRAQRITRLTA